MKKFFWSLQGFALTMLVGALGILGLLLMCVMAYKGGSTPFGIPPSLSPLAWATYAPVVGVTALGFRDVLLSLISFDDKPLIPIASRAGGIIMYLTGLTGVMFAAVSILVVSKVMVTEENAQKLLGVSATVWAASVGVIFDKHFRALKT